MIYEFKTHTTMKPYNRDKWFIMSDIVRDIEVEADNIENALEMWRDEVEGVEVSKNALKNREPMFTEYKDGTCKQTGFVITASGMFNDDYTRWVRQYVECWVKIRTVSECF